MSLTQNRSLILFTIVCLLVSLSLFSGCSGKKKEATIPVTGKVTYKGKPLKFGSVFFTPRGKSSQMPRGTIESDGSFKMGSYTLTDGAPAGDYFVRISCVDTQRPGYVAPTDREPTAGKSLIPEKYSRTPGELEITVTKGMGPVEFNLE